ncbi:FAD-binding oxidoreductase [Actinomadura rudentiformis]|uniref:FAD-binding oxidoreductase n=1 Tax=Actinomadura rudentiformis TaxID=359158 RepID=A0A6H9Z5C2_9ACTN|nr:FAD-binding protein [Actinomadura rudentiformis]KAB2350182.1 FAD-binding oxidoreductase [Actinomadura rudentiformis]
MSEHTRRNVLRGGLAATAAGIAVPALGMGSAEAAPNAAACPPPPGPAKVGRGEPRYPSLASRGYNRRFVGNPEHVWVVGTTEHVVRAVQDAVDSGKRITVRSGGHGFENFVADPAVQVVVDTSAMTAVYYDPHRRAFAVEAGALLGDVYRRLYLGWGVTIPAGWCPSVGAGGHVVGGGFGPLSRSMGLAVDHLHAVEVVVVDRRGRARSVVATREPSDPNRDLWWAHTGGGGGSFGIVTRYWFRTPGALGDDPSRLLPAPPPGMLSFTISWDWSKFTETSFARLVRNHGAWVERNSAPGSPSTKLYSELQLNRRLAGTIGMIGQVPAGSERLLDEHLAAINDGVPVTPVRQVRSQAWLASALAGSPGDPGPVYRLQVKSGYLRRRLTDRQIGVLHHHLTRTDYDHPGGSLSLYTFGGQVNTLAPDATAAPHRDTIMKMFFANGWENPADDARHLTWLRELYRDLFADTGGVPADGAFINYPDTDLADPAWNTGAPWHALYFKDNYARLQQIKATWDPRNLFHHALSIKPPRAR